MTVQEMTGIFRRTGHESGPNEAIRHSGGPVS